MKDFWTARKIIIITSVAWIALFFFTGGYYRNAYRMGDKLYRIVFLNKEPRKELRITDKTLSMLARPFATALNSMYDVKPQMGTDGKIHKLDGITKISPDQGLWMYELCRKIKPQRTLEIGFAYGFSTMFFLAAIQANGMGMHVAMDPFEKTEEYYGIGLQKVKELGMQRFFRFMEEKDITGIPALIREGLQFDVIFIDGNHRFDDVYLDFTLCDYVCAKNGFIILDDSWLPSISRVISFIEKNRSDYRRYPSPIENIRVFQKVGDDHRNWDHFVDF
ncbi:MAG: class I SAM-dependent methyltransferase [Proteobacteria bacterium]|nr:class I SAM-dependent methyltransferase [Pseudomonadota bacterium]